MVPVSYMLLVYFFINCLVCFCNDAKFAVAAVRISSQFKN